MDDLAPNFSLLSTKEKDALILQLLARLEALELENVALREKLNLPPKTPDNSSTPPAAGHKSNGETTHRPKGKAHAGAHRELHPKPTRHRDVPASQCQHCRADVSGVAQKPVHTYDRHGPSGGQRSQICRGDFMPEIQCHSAGTRRTVSRKNLLGAGIWSASFV
jgi:hypothetical protein